MNGYINCPNCNAQILNSSDSPSIQCEYCRSVVPNPHYAHKATVEPTGYANAPAFCANCGNKLQFGNLTCDLCGMENTPVNKGGFSFDGMGSMKKPKSKAVALMLCLVAGWAGAHKFYEGRMILGIIYLATFGFYGIGIIADLIALSMKPSVYYVN